MSSPKSLAPEQGPDLGARPDLLDILVFVLLITGFFLGPLKLLGVSWLAYLAADVLAALIIVLVIAQRMAAQKPLLVTSPLTIPLVLLISYCVLELANPAAPFFRSVLGLRSWVLYLCFYFVGLYSLRTVRQIERLYALLVGLAIVTTAYGVYQWWAGPQAFATWSDAYGRYAQVMWSMQSTGAAFRAFSTFVLPNAFGGNMALIMLLAFSVAASPAMRVHWRVLAAIAFVLMGIGIGVSGSRGGGVHLLLAGAVGVLFIPGIRRRVEVGMIGIVLGGVAIVVALAVAGSVLGQRFATILDPNAFFWKWFDPLIRGMGIALAHPFGMGLGYTAGVPSFIANPAFSDLSVTNIDSGYGSAAAELGFVGLALFTYFALRVGIDGFRTWRGLPAGRLRDLLLGPALFAATYPVVSVIFQPQATLPSSIYCWLLIGMLMKAPRLVREGANADKLLRAQVHPGQ